MQAKILGEHNENVEYLTKETGATITLRGKGSGNPDGKDEELHVLVKLVFWSTVLYSSLHD